MQTHKREYRTGQSVPSSEQFICQSRKKSTLQKNNTSPACPTRGKETSRKYDAKHLLFVILTPFQTNHCYVQKKYAVATNSNSAPYQKQSLPK